MKGVSARKVGPLIFFTTKRLDKKINKKKKKIVVFWRFEFPFPANNSPHSSIVLYICCCCSSSYRYVHSDYIFSNLALFLIPSWSKRCSMSCGTCATLWTGSLRTDVSSQCQNYSGLSDNLRVRYSLCGRTTVSTHQSCLIELATYRFSLIHLSLDHEGRSLLARADVVNPLLVSLYLTSKCFG